MEWIEIHSLKFLNSISLRIRIKIRQKIQQDNLRILSKNNHSLFLETNQIMDMRKQKSLRFCGQVLENLSLKINLLKRRIMISFFQTRPWIIPKLHARTIMTFLTCKPTIRAVWEEEQMEDHSLNKEKFEMKFQEILLTIIADQRAVLVLIRIKLIWSHKIVLIWIRQKLRSKINCRVLPFGWTKKTKIRLILA